MMMSPKHHALEQPTSRIAAGFILLAMAIASPIGFLVALPQGLYNITAFVGFVVVLLDICVALLLIPILRSGGAAIVNWASLLRILYATGLLTATIMLVIRQDGELFTLVWDYSLSLFGLHLLLVGIAMWRSPVLPTIIGALVLIAGVSYLFDSIMVFLDIDTISLSEFTFIGEVVLLIWLLWSGFRLRQRTSPSQ